MNDFSELQRQQTIIIPPNRQRQFIRDMQQQFSDAFRSGDPIICHDQAVPMDITDLREGSGDVAYEGSYADRLRERNRDYINGGRELLGLLYPERKDQVKKLRFMNLLEKIEESMQDRLEDSKTKDQLIREYLAAEKEIERVLKDAYTMEGLEKDEIKKSIEEAANIAKWKQGRPVQCTITERKGDVALTQNLALPSTPGGVTPGETLQVPKDNKFYVVQMEIPIVHATKALKSEYWQIYEAKPPKWFQELSETTQGVLKRHFSQYGDGKNFDGNNFEDKLGSIPCTIRKFPGMTNFSNTVQLIFDEKGHCVDESVRTRSSIVVPFEVKDKAERKRLTDMNIDQLIDSHQHRVQQTAELWDIDPKRVKTPVGLQTLVGAISPKLAKIAKKFGRKDKEGEMMLVADEAGKEFNKRLKDHPNFSLIRSNHPVNAIRGLADKLKLTGRKKDNTKAFFDHFDATVTFLESIKEKFHDESCAEAIDNLRQMCNSRDFDKLNLEEIDSTFQKLIADNFIQNEPDPLKAQTKLRKLSLLSEALQGYGDLTQDPPEHNTDRNYPLMRASYEQIIIEAVGGINTGSCKSGKDRKGLEINHTNSMREYFQLTGRLPRHDDNKIYRKQFVDIQARKMMTDHQSRNAALNASGCHGLKRIEKNLPKDVIAAIRETEVNAMLEEADALMIEAGVNRFDRSTYKTMLKAAFDHSREHHYFSRNRYKAALNSETRPSVFSAMTNKDMQKQLLDIEQRLFKMAKAKKGSYFMDRNYKNAELNKIKEVKKMSDEHFLGRKAKSDCTSNMQRYKASLDDKRVTVQARNEVGPQVNIGQVGHSGGMSQNAERFQQVVNQLKQAHNDDKQHSKSSERRLMS